MTDSRTGQDSGQNHQTRRQFIRKLLAASVYAAPVISSISVANAKKSSGFSFMISSKKSSPMPMMSPSPMGMGSGMGSGGSGGMGSSGMGMLWS